MNHEFKLLIAEALEMDIADVNEDLALDPQDNWDSIALLSVISELDTQYVIQVDVEQLAECRKLSEVYGLVNKN